MKIIMAVILLVLIPSALLAASPIDSVKVNVDEVLQILQDPALKGEEHKTAAKARIWAVVDRVFDFSALSQRTLGRNWNAISAEEKETFIRYYRLFLGQIYLDRVMEFTGEKVEYVKEVMLSAENSEVQTKLISNTQEIEVDYRLLRFQDDWKVYDVVIEGVSMVQNYRSQFNQILARQSMKELLDILIEKVDKKQQNR
ncbi:MAG: ABC transporter substrate-binding protein [Proteobacteria bacterium]|nr:ABC transporter substrate-binding protein [Pseudomonadota bacterium]MBU1710097.1 ABC transporter substrate-binding protein [Pseudomonadota bacterium]